MWNMVTLYKSHKTHGERERVKKYERITIRERERERAHFSPKESKKVLEP